MKYMITTRLLYLLSHTLSEIYLPTPTLPEKRATLKHIHSLTLTHLYPPLISLCCISVPLCFSSYSQKFKTQASLLNYYWRTVLLLLQLEDSCQEERVGNLASALPSFCSFLPFAQIGFWQLILVLSRHDYGRVL